MNESTTTDELVAVVKATLCPCGIVHVDQVLAWLQRQADITRAECLETVWANEQWEDGGMHGVPYDFMVIDKTDVYKDGMTYV